jgi:hypothetical protein
MVATSRGPTDHGGATVRGFARRDRVGDRAAAPCSSLANQPAE